MEFSNYCLYIENDRLFNFAASTARLLKPGREQSTSQGLKKLKKHMREIKSVHDTLNIKAGKLLTPPAAWEWLLDNFYMLRREAVSSRRAFINTGKLRRSGDSYLVSRLCRSLIDSGQGAVTAERCRLFLNGFQTICVLNLSELRIFPEILKAEIISSVANVCRDMQYSDDPDSSAKRMEALFTSLRLIALLDWDEILTSCNKVNEILSDDPTGEYAHMDADTKYNYMSRIEKLAHAEGEEEYIYAKKLIEKAAKENRHIGFYLFPEPSRLRAAAYILFNVAVSIILSLLPAFYFKSTAAAFLLILPISEMLKSITDFILLHIVKPGYVPRMELSGGIPAEGRSLCVISAILSSPESAEKLCRRLEELYHSCRSRDGIYFGLLADLKESEHSDMPEDKDILNAASSVINELNRKYGAKFYLFTRKRVYNGESYSGHERKRGAIMELVSMLLDKRSTLGVCGEKDALHGINYIITLDSDTKVYPGSVESLISAMLHPLNRAVIDRKKGVVTKGHAIIQPRISTELMSANATDFSLIFAGAGGSDPYGGLCGELYMDMFSSGGFAGKGIIDVNALNTCLADRLPENRILSHDALEGAYLRAAFAGDIEFSDAFPSSPLSYYKRQHRWTRGDMQNISWIFHSELPGIERFRLFDSIRRSLLAPFTLAAIVAGFFMPENVLLISAWAAVLALLSRLFISLAEGSLRQREKFRLRRYTRLLSGVGGAIVNSFMRLWLLPYEAYICLSAVLLSLWRMLISHKRLLQWQTAAQSEKDSRSFGGYIKAMWFPLILGLVLLCFSPVIIGKSAGLLWLVSPLCAYALALPAHKDSYLPSVDREFILQAAKENYKYFTTFSTAYDNFLPPDNFQEQPPVGVAHRTSPTNIGLAMCSAIAAADMEIISPKEAALYISRITDTLEKLPKCFGQLYNWYDTHSLEVLNPPYISTVDSGNFYACLVCCRQALLAFGESGLAIRLKALMDAMDFSPLFDSHRCLFYICYDTGKHHGAGGWYDLMASEALLTSYIAAAKGDVPFKHWRYLSRAQLQKDGYRGLASWSGTMFEYLMPGIFLPYLRGSLLYESSRFCLYVQKRRKLPARPWGISESAFYSLDNLLNYRYKANGCPELSLKRGQEKDWVISPYSSFLALPYEPEAAVKNLRKLKNFGASGRYGFMEALDFTPGRCRHEHGEKVQCYMAHHIGMSITSCANLLCDGDMQKYFMSDAAMGAMQPFLQEKLPADGLVINRSVISPPAESRHGIESFWNAEGKKGSSKQFTLLSNGIYNMLIGSDGTSSACWGDISIYGSSRLPRVKGMALKIVDGDSKSFTADSWHLAEDICSFKSENPDLKIEYSTIVSGTQPGELRQIELLSERDRELKICLNFKPILAPYKDYENHPAFWKLGIASEIRDGKLVLHRLRRSSLKDIWLCASCNVPVSISTENRQFNPYLSEPDVLLCAAVSLKAGVKTAVKFAVCSGFSPDEVLNASDEILSGAERGIMPGASAARLGMDSAEYGRSMAMLPSLLSPISNAAAKSELWKYGISGDYPIIYCDAQSSEAMSVLSRFCLLKSCGIECELVYLSSEGGEYHRPMHRRILEFLTLHGLESLLGARAGIHFVPKEAADAVESRAACIIGKQRLFKPELRIAASGLPRARYTVPQYMFENESFRFAVKNTLPGKMWQQILCNDDFGCIISDCGAGSMWYKNAREMRITAAPESAAATTGAESLTAEYNGSSFSLFAANDNIPCAVSFSAGVARWDKIFKGRSIHLTAFVPVEENVRIYIIEGAEGLNLTWKLKPVLGQDACSLSCKFENGIFEAQNKESYIKDLKFSAATSSFCSCKTDFRPQAMEMSLAAEKITVLVCGVCSADKLRSLAVPQNALAELNKCTQHWSSLLGRLKVSTGIEELDNYLNIWGPYQTIACRIMARASVYQSGGAFGFRDQLQDAVNMLYIDPDIAKQRILDCCRHQYLEGDVMHWWHVHPDGDKGIRSRCSDDLLWLVWAVCEYCKKTGDLSICKSELPFLNSPVLGADEGERYEVPAVSDKSDTVLNHIRAALGCCERRGLGPHGLPFFGSGDWNDGLNKVDGESVWLGWFYSICAFKFSELLKRLHENDAQNYYSLAEKLGKAADSCFNGSFYYRGFHADGSVLGGEQRIDSLPQSWAAFNPFSDKEKVKTALKYALSKLVDTQHSTVKLFTPPYRHDERDVGYISSYGEGFRENGGQYTHAAVWLASACFKCGMAKEGREILLMLLPENHDLSVYEAEPYVLAADVYSAPGHEGEAGWTWYTGSAGWYYTVALEDMLGIKLQNSVVLPPSDGIERPAFKVTYRDSDGKTQHINYPFS